LEEELDSFIDKLEEEEEELDEGKDSRVEEE